jgi:two-component system CheB/CheR fusion protein
MTEASRQWVYGLEQPGSAGPGTMLHGLIFTAIIIVVAVIVAAFGDVKLRVLPQFAAFHAGFVFLVNGITAFLLYGQFAYRRLPSYCLLATGFLVGSLIMIPFILTFPGALTAQNGFIGGPQSSIWVWHAWHTLFPIVMGLALWKQGRADRPVAREMVQGLIARSVVATLLLILLVSAAVTVFHDRLPVLILEGRTPFKPNFYWAGGIAALATLVPFLLAAWLARRRSILHVWLTLVLLAFLADEAASLGAYPRYALGWYFGRIDSMLAMSVLLVVFLTDINRLYQRLAEAMDRLFDANRKLSSTVDEKDAVLGELREREARLREVDQRKDTFIATLAHELRNPLAPLRVAARLLARKPEREVVEWATGVIDRQVAQMARLLEDLLDISRIKRNRLELRRARITLQEVVEAACEQSRPLLEEAKQELHVDLPAEPVYLDGDKARLAQVFANLLNNAARYTRGPGTVTLDGQVREGEAVVRVTDTGIGIEAEALGSVFDVFFQARPPGLPGDGGVGLGLPLVKGLVELHGGSVTARSEGVGKGSEFTVRLPVLVDAIVTTPVPLSGTEAAVERALRVLVVDDNRDNADSMNALLEVLGHHPAVAYGAGEALALGAQFRPEVVLLDIGLPDMSGYECASLLRKTDWGRDLLLVAMTGWGKTEDKHRAFAAGFDEHLTKPVDLDGLESLLARRAEASV